MQLYLLHLRESALFQRAADRVLDCVDVASCTLEPRQLRLRFLAPSKAAEPLVEKIYLEGGLAWCTRHPLRDDAHRRAATATQSRSRQPPRPRPSR